MRLEGKVALITGAGSGIGKAISVLFAKEGANIVAVDNNDMLGKETVNEITGSGGDAIFVHADVSNSHEVKHMVDFTVQKRGKLDVLCNNAGIAVVGNVVDTSEEDWDRIIDVNLKGVFLGCKYAIPYMIKQGGGSIVNTASVNGFFGLPNEVAYDASKGGVVLLTKATAIDFGEKNIRVNCICPGIADTPLLRNVARVSGDYEQNMEMFSKMNAAFHRMVLPSEVAYVALFLASDESSAVTGSAYMVDAGYSAT